MEIDDAFIKRVYRSSAFLWGFGVLVSLFVWQGLVLSGVKLNPCGGLLAALGWTFGSAISFGTMWSLDWVIRRVFVPGNERARQQFGRLAMLKLPVMAGVIALIVLVGRSLVRHPKELFPYFVGIVLGVVLTQAVIFLKVLGVLICEHSNDSSRGVFRCTKEADRH